MSDRINGYDLSALGVVRTSRTLPHAGGVKASRVNVPGRRGTRRVGASRNGGLLTLVCTVARDTPELLQDTLDVLAGIEGECVIQLASHPDREWIGELQEDETTAKRGAPQWVSTHASYTLAFWCDDPAARAREETVATSGATLQYGNVGMPLHITVANGAGSGTITRILVELRNSAGVAVRKTDWAGALLAGSTWVAEAETCTITVDGANARGGLSGESQYPEAERGEGTHTVHVTYWRSGVQNGGGATSEIRYRKRWLTPA